MSSVIRHQRRSRWLRCLICVVAWWLMPMSDVRAESAVQRLRSGPFRVQYSRSHPGHVLWQDEVLLRNLYFYTSPGNRIEGFNFRDLDGYLDMGAEAVPDGHRLIWSNRRDVYNAHLTRSTGKLAGLGSVIMTLSDDTVTLRYWARLQKAAGAGEIGFFIPEAFLTGGKTAEFEAHRVDGSILKGSMPLAQAGKTNVCVGLKHLVVRAAERHVTLDCSGTQFTGAHSLYLQDFRKTDRTPGCFRFVLSFTAARGCAIDLRFRLHVRDGLRVP